MTDGKDVFAHITSFMNNGQLGLAMEGLCATIEAASRASAAQENVSVKKKIDRMISSEEKKLYIIKTVLRRGA